MLDTDLNLSSGGWENIPKGANRLVTLPTTSGASLVLTTVYMGR